MKKREGKREWDRGRKEKGWEGKRNEIKAKGKRWKEKERRGKASWYKNANN